MQFSAQFQASLAHMHAVCNISQRFRHRLKRKIEKKPAITGFVCARIQVGAPHSN